jgi:hypothetical protein
LDVNAATAAYPQGCAEKEALSNLAGKDGTPASLKAKLDGEQHSIETYNGSKEDYDRASDEERKKMRANPCPKCATMLKEQNIQVYAPNAQQGTIKSPSGVDPFKNPWNGTATFTKPKG